MLTDNEIKETLKSQADIKECIHQRYEEACGEWCELKHIWCEDMSGKSEVNTCTEYKPLSSIVIAKQILDYINRQDEEYEHLLKVARKMHTWIFLNTGDEQAVYDEIGLSNEDNMLLGYGGQIELTVGEEVHGE